MNQTTESTAIFAPLWKRKWLILLVGLVVGAGTYLYYKRQPPIYQVSTQLYLGAGSEEAGLLNGGAAKALQANGSNATALINSVVVEAVHKKLHLEHNAAAARGKVKAKAAEKSQFIVITAEARKPKAAALLANDTAQAYITRQRLNYTREIEKAVAIARRQLRRVEETHSPGKGKGSSSNSSTSVVLTAAGLSTKVNQLEAELSIKGVQQVSPAKPTSAVLLSPKPRSNAIFGFVLGLILASVAAFALSRFDRRLRSLSDVESAFQTQILTALPVVKRPIVDRDGRSGPARSLVEPLRRLHTTLQMGGSFDPDRAASPRSILFVSADPGDGKSTLIANLARVQRDAGERVAVIEADFRRPAQSRLLKVTAPHGLADVLEGKVTVQEGIHTVEPAAPGASTSVAEGGSDVATVVESRSTGTLSVLLSGGPVDNPPALLSRPAMSELLSSVAYDFDYVLIDAPPPLEVSDVMPLLNMVDGIVIVARIGHTREISAQRLRELLMRASSTRVLGTVAGSVTRTDIEKYGFASASSRRLRRN
ncbi:MAG TPA: Wzz/FepE/Etk N-terminal domain-containing protein [Solirubrobacteraceae bacterium]|jgi:succinoglycan biosynthesis transport protein ExoP|nr:Wzz/FepE/Etk N-terminal domain-containing protein [Solirubrobacteraceae bacterium]